MLGYLQNSDTPDGWHQHRAVRHWIDRAIDANSSHLYSLPSSPLSLGRAHRVCRLAGPILGMLHLGESSTRVASAVEHLPDTSVADGAVDDEQSAYALRLLAKLVEVGGLPLVQQLFQPAVRRHAKQECLGVMFCGQTPADARPMADSSGVQIVKLCRRCTYSRLRSCLPGSDRRMV